MFLSPWNLIQAILFALGIWWCKEIFSRWPDDLKKMREPDDRADASKFLRMQTRTTPLLTELGNFLFGYLQIRQAYGFAADDRATNVVERCTAHVPPALRGR
jgi:hypothetical protein